MRAIDDDPNGQLNKKIFFRDFAAMLPRIFWKTFVERRFGAWQQRGSMAAKGGKVP
jgi:hypothetical protein